MEQDSFTSTADVSFSERFIHTSWEDGYNRRLFFIRLGLMSVTIIAVVVNALTGYAIQDQDITCMWDGLFVITSGINRYLAENDHARNSLMIISSLIVDSLLMVFVIRWVLFGNTWRPVIFLFVFYMSRGIIQVISR